MYNKGTDKKGENGMKYLVLTEEFEWGDYFVEPVCVTDDYTAYKGKDYKVYEILKDGTFNLIKDYDDDGEEHEEGICLCIWDNEELEEKHSSLYDTNDDRDGVIPMKILARFPNMKPAEVTGEFIKGLETLYKFRHDVSAILFDIHSYQFFGEEIDEEKWLWVTLGYYRGDCIHHLY